MKSERATVTVQCHGILCDRELVLNLPEGWEGSVETPDGHYVYCPKCAKTEAPFFRAQCPGCVSGFPDCGLGKAFLYASAHLREAMTQTVLNKLEHGVCSFRVNGTVGANYQPEKGIVSVFDMNLADVAPPESGKAVADKVREYIERYPTTK